MLPSSGYFRSVNCPFFESGLCERPHCHFRHVKKDPVITMRPRSTSGEDALPVGSSTPESKPDLLRLVSEAVLKMQREMDQGRSRNHVQAKPCTPSINSVPSLNPSFLPNKFSTGLSDSNSSLPVLPSTLGNSSLLTTPLPAVTPLAAVTTVSAITPLSSNKYLDSLKEDVTPVVPKRSASSSSSGQYMFVLAKDTIYRNSPSKRLSKSNVPVLEYTPTPIAELKKMKEQQNSKYGLTFKEQSVVDDLEYDPVLNFSAGFPNKKKKLITPYSPHPVKRVPLPDVEEAEHGVESKRFRFSVDSDPEDITYNDFHDNTSDHEAHFSDDDATSVKPPPSPEKTTKETAKTIKNDETVEVKPTKGEATFKFDIIKQILSESEKCKKAILDRTIHNKDAAVNNEATEPAVQKEALESKIKSESKEETPENSNETSKTELLSTDSSLLKSPNKLGTDTNKANDSKADVSKIDSVQKSHKTNESKSEVSKTDSVHKSHSRNSRSSSSHSTKSLVSKHHSSKESSKSSEKASKSVSKDKLSRNSPHDKHSHSASQEKHSRSSSQEKHSHSSSHEKHSLSSSHEKQSHSSSHGKHSSHDKASHKLSSSTSHKSSSSKQDSSHKVKPNNSHESKSGDKHEKAKDKSVRTSTDTKSVHKDKKHSSSSSKPEKDRRASSSSDKSLRLKRTDSYSEDTKKHEKSKHRHESRIVKSSKKNATKHSTSYSHRVKDKHKKQLSKRVSSSEDDYDSESSSDVEEISSDSDSDRSLRVEQKNANMKENKKYEKAKHKHESKTTKSPTKLSSKLTPMKGSNLLSSHRLKDEHRKNVSKNGSANDDDFSSESSLSDVADHSSEVAIADVELDTDLDEHDTYEECLRIFNEYTPMDNEEIKYKDIKVNNRSKLEEQISSKHRVAHAASSSDFTTQSRKSKSSQVPSKVSASQAMFNRYSKVQKMLNEQSQSIAAAAAAAAAATKPSAFLNSVTSNVPTKRRIAHVPNVSAIITATNTVKAIASNTTDLASDLTVAQTNSKGAIRVAHIPKQLTMPRPTIPAEYGSRVPCNVRQRYLNIIIDECLKIYDDVQDAFERALSEEKNAYQRSSNRTVYINVVVNNIKRIRSEVSGEVPVTPVIREEEPSTSNDMPSPMSPVMMSPPQVKSPPKPNPRTVSHQAVLGGKKAANVSYSIQRHKAAKPSGELAGPVLYRLLSSYILTEQQLIENCYPQAHPVNHGEAVIPNFDMRKSIASSSLDRICRRCGARYKVSSKGVYLTEEECVYHYGRSFKRRVSGTIEHRYTCCEGDLSSEGCCCAPVHVSENVDMDCLTGYVATLPKTPPINGDYGVFALDCEMCYTLKGLELTRLTVIGSNMKPVYESFVKPENRILDYNTKFSGITEEDMIGVQTTLRDVQAVLLNKFSSKTILIGHSLESDFKALKLIHGTVIDTSVVFPHRLGPPKKRALRTLMAEYLNKIIQNSVDGHDSQEDAISCMELMMWKIKEDLKKLIR